MKKIAIVADWLDDHGGAEHVILAMVEMFPDAVIFTSVYNPDKFPTLKNREVRTSFLQKIPAAIRPSHQKLFPLMPAAFSNFDLSDFDVIISSSSSGFSKCVRKKRKDQMHICYCHTPVRYLYHAREEYENNYPCPWWLRPFKFLIPKLLDHLTTVDQIAAHDVDHFVANSKYIAKRIEKFYHKKATVVYPGIDTTPFIEARKKTKKSDYFLAVGRFIPYKKFDLLIKTFAKNKLPLKLAGKGPELEKCKQLAKKLKATNIEFLGFVPRSDLPKLYAEARAFLFPAEEDFGLTPVEAMAAGTPVIYYHRGGAVESVAEFGIPFTSQTIEGLERGIKTFIKKEKALDFDEISDRGQLFDTKVFQESFRLLTCKL